jgi:hypothetical protein
MGKRNGWCKIPEVELIYSKNTKEAAAAGIG